MSLSDEGILDMAFLAGQNGMAWTGGTIPHMDKDGRVLPSKVQVLQPTILPPGIEGQVCCRLTTESRKSLGLVENYIQGDTAVAVTATVCHVGVK